MRTSVSTFLREFPRVRRAALAGETVIIETRGGNLVLKAAAAEQTPAYGSMSARIIRSDDDLDRPTLAEEEWASRL
jgi:hypothetical protein